MQIYLNFKVTLLLALLKSLSLLCNLHDFLSSLKVVEEYATIWDWNHNKYLSIDLKSHVDELMRT